MNQPLISIIIPTYNRAYLLSETLESILIQNYNNWECIVVDDGSTDNTKEIVNNYILNDSRFQYFTRPDSLLKGPNSCRNYGFEKSSGNFIQWFDSDDLYYPNALMTYMTYVKHNVDVIVAKLDMVDFKSLKKFKENNFFSQNLIEDYLLGKITFYISGPIWRRSFLQKTGELFDSTISNLDDWDFNLRMLYRNPMIQYIDNPLIQYRIHPESLSHEIDKLNYKEICSEIFAREKHIKLLEFNKKVDSKILNRYLKNRFIYFLIKALQIKDSNRINYLIMLLKKQFELNDFFGMLKAVFGFCLYFSFNKGYFFLRKI